MICVMCRPDTTHDTCLTDNCPDISNPNQADDDLDGTGDVCDACPSFPPVKIDAIYYNTLQDAYNSAQDWDSIQSQAVEFTGALSIDQNKSVTFESGYDCDYTANTGKTILKGNMMISNGKLTINGGTFEVQ